MDRASRALAQDPPLNVRKSYAVIADRGNVPLTTVWYREHGRPSMEEKAQGQQYLNPQEEKALVDFLLRMADLGCPVRVKFLPSLAFSIARRRGIIKAPNKNWPQAFERRHPELRARRVKAMDWRRHDKNIYDKITHWFEVIKTELCRPDIVPSNVYNMDETGVMLSMLGAAKVLIGRDDQRDYRGARVKREMVTAIECVSATGEFLQPMVIWPAKTHRSNWTTFATPGWYYALSEKGYNDSKISLEWIKRVFDPQTRARANNQPRLLISDGFVAHETLDALEFCFKNNIILARLPSHTSHKLQPCDIAIFPPLKNAYRKQAERLERAGTNTIGKEHFTTLYGPARERAITKKNILAGWAKAGLHPLSLNRVLRDIVKPVVPLIISKAGEVTVVPHAECEVLRTPLTPVTGEALMSLLHMIKHVPNNETNKLHKQRLQEKVNNAALRAFAKESLQQDHIEFLVKMNNEARPRRSTKSLILGKAKVMSYEDIKELREKRAVRDAITTATLKRCRKRKNGPEDVGATKGKQVRKRKKVVECDEDSSDEFGSSENEPEAGPRAISAQVNEAPQPMAFENWTGEEQ